MAAPSPKFAPIEPDWCIISGMSRRTTYQELGRGNLKAIKVGTRTLIDVEAGLAWLRSLPAAKIRAPRERRPLPEVRDAPPFAGSDPVADRRPGAGAAEAERRLSEIKATLAKTRALPAEQKAKRIAARNAAE